MDKVRITTQDAKIIFVLGSFTMGGVQSNLVRVLPYLLQKGVNVTLLLVTDKIERSFLPYLAGVKIQFLKEYLPISNYALINSSAIMHSFTLDKKKIIRGFSGFTHVHAVDSETMILGHKVARILNVPLSTGSYHPREFTWTASNCYFRDAQMLLYKQLPVENRVFFNDGVAKETLTKVQCDGRIIPLTIADTRPIYGNSASKKIVTVGRLVGYKSYNEQLIRTIDAINQKYLAHYELHIYGDGPDKAYLESLAAQVQSKVFFHGNLAYSKLQAVLSDALLFVGVGSALLEAAALGIPCMYGIDSISEPFTYGYFHSVTGTNLGDRDPDLKLISYFEFFDKFLKEIDDGNYKRLCDLEVSKANFHSLDKVWVLWIELFSDSKIKDFSYCELRYFVSNAVWLIFNTLGLRLDRSQRYLL